MKEELEKWKIEQKKTAYVDAIERDITTPGVVDEFSLKIKLIDSIV